MTEYIEQAGRFVRDTIRNGTNARCDEAHSVGFSRAAGITLQRIQGKIDGLKEQMENGPALTKTEQLIFMQLDQLKSDIEADFDRYWRGTDVDWRPKPPVTKGVRLPNR